MLNSYAGDNQCTDANKPTAASGGVGLTVDDVPAAPGDAVKLDDQTAVADLGSVPVENDVRLRLAVPAAPRPSN